MQIILYALAGFGAAVLIIGLLVVIVAILYREKSEPAVEFDQDKCFQCYCCGKYFGAFGTEVLKPNYKILVPTDICANCNATRK